MPAGARTVVVTGATGGLGREAAKAIAASAPRWHVVLAARDPSRIVDEGDRLHPHSLDLASLASVRAFAAGLDDLPPVGAVVCNAGIQIVSGATFTGDGFETTFQVNHLAHFLLVDLLRERLQDPGRVIFVSSGTHDPSKRTGMPDPAYTSAEDLAHPHTDGEDPGVAGRRRYTTAKLCNVLAAYELARRAPAGVTANAFDPGLMPGTGLGRDYTPFQRFVWNRVMPGLTPIVPNVNTPAQSGRALARLAVDPDLEGVTGAYFMGARPVASSIDSYDRRKARDLWETSARLVA